MYPTILCRFVASDRSPLNSFLVTFLSDYCLDRPDIKLINTPFKKNRFFDPKSNFRRQVNLCLSSGFQLETIMELDSKNDITEWVFFLGKGDFYLIKELKDKLNLAGLIYKNRLKINTLASIMDLILENPPYYSPRILRFLEYLQKLDSFDLSLLQLLKKGISINQLTNHLPGSSSTIYRRKKRLKILLNTEDSGDIHLIQKAIKLGLLKK